MKLFTFISLKKLDGKHISVPAVLFSNSTYNYNQFKQKYPGLMIKGMYDIDASIAEVPLDCVLYEPDRELDLLSINANLEEQVRLLKEQLASASDKLKPFHQDIKETNVVEGLEETDDEDSESLNNENPKELDYTKFEDIHSNS